MKNWYEITLGPGGKVNFLRKDEIYVSSLAIYNCIYLYRPYSGDGS